MIPSSIWGAGRLFVVGGGGECFERMFVGLLEDCGGGVLLQGGGLVGHEGAVAMGVSVSLRCSRFGDDERRSAA